VNRLARAAAVVVALAAPLAGAVLAQGTSSSAEISPLEGELRRCRAIADSLTRVGCYDAIALPVATATVSTVAASPPSAPIRVSGVATGADPAREFGMPERPVTQSLQFIDSAFEGDFDGWTPGAKVRLANGQLWEIVDGSTASYSPTRNPKIRISRGLLGSYFMAIEGVAQKPRVRRLQ
jgi:hypothetical protein